MLRQQSIPNVPVVGWGFIPGVPIKLIVWVLDIRSFKTSFADVRTTCREEDGFPFWHEDIEWRPCPSVMGPRGAGGRQNQSDDARTVRRADLPSGDPTTAIAGVRHVSLLSRSPAWGQQQHAIRRTGECDQRCNDQAFACKNLTASMRLPSGSRMKAA